MYEIDSIDYSAPPRVITIKGVSTAISKNMRHERHNKHWEFITLQAIAGEIAGANNLALYYSGENPFFERQTQAGISDIEFLHSLCSDFGLNLKVHDNKLIIYDIEANYERESVSTITQSDKHLISWKFSSKGVNVYKSARVSYHDHVKNENYFGEYSDGSEEGSGEILEINERVESQGEAQTLAEKRLLLANKNEVTGTILIMGCVDYLAGNNINVSGFGVFDGKYTIESATHSLTSGYTTSLKLSMGGASKSGAQAMKSARKVKAAKLKTSSTIKTPELYYEGEKYYGHD